MKMVVNYWNKKGEKRYAKRELVDIRNFSISEFNKRKHSKITFSEIMLFDEDRDMTMCVPGDQLVTVHGMIVTYVEKLPSEDFYDHKIIYPDGSYGTRVDSGHVYRYEDKRLKEDYDIIGIVI